MIDFSHTNLLFEILPEEVRLVNQAKSGETNAFVKLYDASVERVYRYIHFLVPNNKVAEGITFQVFFRAWEHLDHYQIFGASQIFRSSFVVWLYSIAQNQVAVYYRTHKKPVDPDNDFTVAVRGGDFRKEFQVIRDGLRFLTAEQQQILILKFIVGMSNKNIRRVMAKSTGDIRVLLLQGLQALTEYVKEMELRVDIKGFHRVLEDSLKRLLNGTSTLDECLEHYPRYANLLRPLLETVLLMDLGRDVKPLPAFNAYTHDALIQYIQTHPHRPKLIITPAFQRAALAFAVLVVAFLVTGTAKAQSAMPGDPLFYAWKRTSEQALRAISLDTLGTDIMLAERRLEEWIAVSNDPALNASARLNYLEALKKLKSGNDAETLAQIVPALKQQEEMLKTAGLVSPELDNYLVEAMGGIPASAPVQAVPTDIEATAVEPVPAFVVPTGTSVPIQIVPTGVAAPTEVAPTEKVVPTKVVPTKKEVPTKKPAPTKKEDPNNKENPTKDPPDKDKKEVPANENSSR